MLNILTSFFVLAADINFRVGSSLPGNVRELSLADLITFAIRALFIIAGLMALLYLILGGIAWITSGGSKEGVDKARDKIQAAVIGLIVVVAVIAIVTLLENVLDIGLGLSQPIKFPKLTPDLGTESGF